MKRLALGALGVGLALAVVATPGEAQAVRVGVNLARVGVRFEYREPRAYPVTRIYRHDSRQLARERDRLLRLERELYREWLAFEYHRWLRYDQRARFRSQREWERDFLRDRQRAEREYRKWLRERDRYVDRGRPRAPRVVRGPPRGW